MASQESFDYIVGGAGAAGCVVANRLSADPDRSVLLIEAGKADESAVNSRGVGPQLPLTRAQAEEAVAEQLSTQGTRLDSWSAATDGAEVTVRCTRRVRIAFGWLFLGGAPLDRTAVAAARAPTVP